jgi:2-haloacid dehalogenase
MNPAPSDAVGSPKPSAKPRSLRRPAAVAFDVVETLFSLEPVGRRFEAVGLPAAGVRPWFIRFLRDGIAMDAAGAFKPFADVAGATLAAVMAEAGLEPRGPAVASVIAGFAELPAYPDAAPAFALLRDAGIPAYCLTNGSQPGTERLLKRAGLDGLVRRVISIEEIGHWKPRAEVYRHTAKVIGVEPQRPAMTAVHSWDLMGAAKVGLTTAWVSRLEKRTHPLMGEPDVRADRLDDACRTLAGGDR